MMMYDDDDNLQRVSETDVAIARLALICVCVYVRHNHAIFG